MIDALVSDGLVDQAISLFRTWIEKVPANMIMYSTLIKGFAASGEPARAMEMFKEARAGGMEMNFVSYTALIDAHARSGDMVQAKALLEQMQTDGCEPNTITYSTLVKGHCLQGEMDQALEMFQDMERRGLSADAVVFNTMLDGCVRTSRFALADRLIVDMRTTGVVPTKFTLSITVKMWGKRHRLVEAFKAVETMPTEYGFQLDTQIGTCLISACLYNNAPEKALQALETMKTWPHGAPDANTYRILTSGLQQRGFHDKAAQLAKEAPAGSSAGGGGYRKGGGKGRAPYRS
jgi:pentatricopeptide repeat protein